MRTLLLILFEGGRLTVPFICLEDVIMYVPIFKISLMTKLQNLPKTLKTTPDIL